jgi:hypothetical protein
MAKKKGKKIQELVDSVKEIAPGVKSEMLTAMFLNQDVIRQPAPLYRLDSGNHRYYYRFDENDEPVFYTSVTTMIKNTLPTSPYLIKWLADKGEEEGRAEAAHRALYGTFLHTCCVELMIMGKFDLDGLSEKLTIFLTKEKAVPGDDWVGELKKDILAFAQFMIDYQVKPLAVEICLWHPEGFAGAIDIVCELSVEEKGFFGETYLTGANKGRPKESKQIRRMNAVVDIKSGRKGFYESHEVQLGAYLEMWRHHYPDVPIDRLYNFAPKDWRSTPSYNLKDQTGSKNIKKLPYLVSLAEIEDDKRENIVTVLSGVIDLTKGLENNIEEKTFIELIKGNK